MEKIIGSILDIDKKAELMRKQNNNQIELMKKNFENSISAKREEEKRITQEKKDNIIKSEHDKAENESHLVKKEYEDKALSMQKRFLKIKERLVSEAICIITGTAKEG